MPKSKSKSKSKVANLRARKAESVAKRQAVAKEKEREQPHNRTTKREGNVAANAGGDGIKGRKNKAKVRKAERKATGIVLLQQQAERGDTKQQLTKQERLDVLTPIELRVMIRNNPEILNTLFFGGTGGQSREKTLTLPVRLCEVLCEWLPYKGKPETLTALPNLKQRLANKVRAVSARR